MPGSKLGLPAMREGKVGEMQLESTNKGRERLWGTAAAPLPMSPNPAPASRVSRKGRRAGGMLRGPDPALCCC